MRERPGLGPHALAAASVALGGGSLLLFGAFLFGLDLTLVDLALATPAALACNTLLSGVFFGLHSGMTRQTFRESTARWIPARAHGAVYSVVSGLSLLAVVLLWQPADVDVVHLEGAARVAARAVFWISIGGFVWGTRTLTSLDSFGALPLLRPDGGAHDAGPLVEQGPYRWVRHPFYTCTLVMIWACPDVTVDRLTFDLLWSAWIAGATLLEERDLVAQFGDAYRDYQRRVPMLVPWRRRR